MLKDSHQKRRTAILLVGNYRPTLAVARALAPLGHRIVVAGQGGEGAAEYSRHVDQVTAIRDPENRAVPAWCDAQSLRRAGIGMVIPITEDVSRQIAERRHILSDDIVWVTPPADVVLTCLDKPQMFERCRSLAIPTEAFAKTTRRELHDAVEAVGVPCVIRPDDSTRRIGDEKVVFVESLTELETPGLSALPADEPLTVQRKAGGVRHNLYFAAECGRLVGVCQARIGRTDRADGSGLAVEGETVEPSSDLLGWTQALVRSLDYHGIGCAQFLVDPRSGATTFLEINPRVAGNHAIAEAAGLPLARLSVELATGQAMPSSMIVGRTGLRFAWTYGDLRGLREALRQRRATAGGALAWAWRIAAAAIRADLHMTWSRSDPRPTLALYARQFGVGRLAARPRTSFVLGGASRA